jgi:hypothetical protein
MRKRMNWIILPLMGACLISGCAVALVGGAAVGAVSGTYYYINGELKTDYYNSFDAVWNACEKTIADMHGLDVQPVKEIGNGKITAVINQEQVRIAVTYKAKNLTTVSVRVGLVGNKLPSQMIHDKIGEYVVKK